MELKVPTPLLWETILRMLTTIVELKSTVVFFVKTRLVRKSLVTALLISITLQVLKNPEVLL